MKATRLGNYDILDKLGEGGMGEVYRARDSRLNRSVAVKILPQDVANDPTRRTRFEQEARALGALNHPNIVAVYDTGEENGQAYIVSELVDGESLRAVVDRGRLTLRKLLDMAVQIADALAAAHSVGIVHRDLKPENVMVTGDGRVKVLDFGLAKQTMPQADGNTATIALSQPGTVLGTAGYMSPEQVRGAPLDHRSDIFSFGCVLYELVTGQRAFQSASSVETMNAILHDDPREIEAGQTALPLALATIVHRCLEKRSEQRFQSAADLAFALRSVSPSSASGPQPLSHTAHPPPGKRWLWPAIAVLGGTVLFAAGFFLRDRTLRHDPPTFQRITFRKGLVSSARFTPDGRNVLYSANWDGAPGRVFMATPGNPEARDLDLPNGSILLNVSSKDEIAFMMGPYAKDGSGVLSRSAISGGHMRPWLEGVKNADWSPDGSTMAIWRRLDGKNRLEYPIGKVLIPDVAEGLLGLRVSPDGTRVAFAHYSQGSSIELSAVDTSGKVTSLGIVAGQTFDIVDPMLAWTPDGREIWFRSFDLKEWGTIYAVDLKGRRRVVMRLPGHVTLYDIARDGRLLLRTDTRQLGVLGTAPGEAAERDLSCLDESILNGITADGSFVVSTVIGESGGPKGSVYLRKTDGSAPIRLGDGSAFAVSPDGKWVSAYSSTDPATRRYVLQPTGAGEEHEVAIPELKSMNLVYGWSSDNQTLFLHGAVPKKNNVWQNYSWNLASGSLKPIGPEGVADNLPLLSPDRQQILDMGPDGHWRVYPVAGGEGRAVEGLSPHDVLIGWRDDNHSMFLITHRDDNKTVPLSVLDLVSGQKTSLKEIHPTRPVDQVLNMKITPDGRAYAYNFLVKLSDLYVAGNQTR
jgi:serine/threonine protein kinase/Tol biopolymer transport system component